MTSKLFTTLSRRALMGLALAGATALAVLPAQADAGFAPGFAERDVQAGAVKLHYRIGGQGSPVVLLHGYTQTGHMWGPLANELARRHTVIVPDLRGAGGSDKPAGGYDKKTLAQDVRALLLSLGLDRSAIVGHDIGLMVAYAYAAQYPQATDKLVLMDAFLPGIGDWKNVWLLRDLWHFHFHGEVPLALVAGRERTYFEYFKSFELDAKDFAGFAGTTKLTMPLLVLGGEKASGGFLIEQARLVASNVQGQIVKGSGHWLMEEATEQVVPTITRFID